MNNSFTLLNHFRICKLVSTLVLLFAIQFVGENVFSYFDFASAETLEFAENQEEESKSSGEKELEDGDKLVNTLIYYQFIKASRTCIFNDNMNDSEPTWTFVDTPPPEVS